MIKLEESFREKNIFNILPFFNSWEWDLGFVSKFFYSFDRFFAIRVDSLIPICLDTYPASGSRNFADPTNPDL